MVPEGVTRYRAEYRADVSAHYRGPLHLAVTLLGTLAAFAFAVAHVHQLRALEWIAIPLAFLGANFGEYQGHRGPMHFQVKHPRHPLRIVYERHTRQHHRFFVENAMSVDSTRDFAIVLFPPAMLIFFIGALLFPACILLRLILGANVAWLCAATGLAYFAIYELMHLAYHLPADSWLARLPFVASSRRRHAHHHDPHVMQKLNFNITFPIFDWIYGTHHSGTPQ